MQELYEKYSAMHLASAPVIQGPQDTRDYIFGSTAQDNRSTDFQWNLSALPAKVDLLPYTEAVEDQGQYGSCVGHGIVSACEAMFAKYAVSENLSPMYAYYNARRRMHEVYDMPISDSGAYIRLGMAAAGKWGLCLEEHWPYRASGVNQQPSQAAYSEGELRLVTRYETCGGYNGSGQRDLVADLKVALASGYPVVFGVPLLDSFYYMQGKLGTHVAQYTSKQIARNELNYVGDHCMCIIGYDDTLQAFIVENSWGPRWGDGGFVALSYEHMRANAYDCFVMREVDGLRLTIPAQYYSTYVAPEPAPIEPEPIPEPLPEPTPEPQPQPGPTPKPTPEPQPVSGVNVLYALAALAVSAFLGKFFGVL